MGLQKQCRVDRVFYKWYAHFAQLQSYCRPLFLGASKLLQFVTFHKNYRLKRKTLFHYA